MKKTPAALKRAEDAILAAKKYGDDDVKYLSALALIYEDRLMFSESKTTWERVLEINPDNLEALAGMARFYAKEVEKNKFRVDLSPLEDEDYFYDENLARYYDTYYLPLYTEPLSILKKGFGKPAL
ncbi:hypothetical protein AMJ80_06400 [bacterium SM23_31]|nr:MAG: hypothetical protein AMJ80_06400 [bacterium SM23_31]